MFARLTMMRALILGAFVASLYYFFIFDSGTQQQSAIAAAKADIVNQQKQLTQINQKLDRALEYQRSASEMGEALNKLLAYIPENFRLQDFMKTVSEEAKMSGLNIIRVAENRGMGNQAKHTDFEELAVNVELQGTFAQQMTFLSNLTKQKQIFILQKFTLDREGGANSNDVEIPILNFRGEIHAYRYIGGKSKS
jgi:Tfp pilus assembly protein PilO